VQALRIEGEADAADVELLRKKSEELQ